MTQEVRTARPQDTSASADAEPRIGSYARTAKRGLRLLGSRMGIVEAPPDLLAQECCDKSAYARQMYWRSNRGLADAQENFDPELIGQAVHFNYLAWPKRVRTLIAGKDVLDVGCGTGLHGIGCLVFGARSYTGIDPRIALDYDKSKNLRTGKWESFGSTGRQIMAAMPRIRLVHGRVDDLPESSPFDVVLMHNVTEHLLDLEAVFLAVSQRLRPGGLLVFTHHNFYAWNGHHLAPKSVSDIDSEDPEQRSYRDWAHLEFQAPEDHYFRRGLNRIRLHELQDITERHFDLIEWTPRASSQEQGGGRLTPEIRARHPELSDLDFTTQSVFCRAAPKGEGIARLEQEEGKKVLNRFSDEPLVARLAYRHFNAGRDDLDASYVPRLFDRAVEFNYLSWPKKIRGDVSGRDVLDVGCGTGLHAVGFVVVGVNSYTGVDPKVALDDDRGRNLRNRTWQPFGWTGRQLMAAMPRINLVRGNISDLDPRETFGVAIMHNVTEHLLDLEEVFAAIVQHLPPNGLLIFNHHNFYCWNGHHMAPKTVSDIDPEDPEQKLFLDWAHLDYDPPAGHYFRTGLNRIRLQALRDLTERYFEILDWIPMPSKPEQGADRLTDRVRARHPELSDEEFITQNVLCRARPLAQ